MSRESDIESTIVRWAAGRGIASIKLSGPHDRGKPDRVFLRHGRACFIEFKRPGGRLSRLQEFWIAKLRRLGFECEIHDTLIGAKDFLHAALLMQPAPITRDTNRQHDNDNE